MAVTRVPKFAPSKLARASDIAAGSSVQLLASDSAATAKLKLETINPEIEAGSPEGVGNLVMLPPARILVPGLSISQAQNIKGVAGSSVLVHDGTALADLGGGVSAFITMLDDHRSKSGIAGQGVWGDFTVDAKATKNLANPIVHGVYAGPRSGSGTFPTIRNIGVYQAKTNGIHVDTGNDKLVADRMRQEGADGVGMYFASSDFKGRALGSVAKGSSCEVNGAAVEIDQFDFWRPTGMTADPTLKISGASGGCVIKSGTVEGKTLLIGKNSNAANRYINSKMQFAFVRFKHDEKQSPDSYVEVRNADLVEFFGCMWGGGEGNVTPWDYFIKLTAEGDAERLGFVKVMGGSGMLRYLGRTGSGMNRMRIDAGKHICSHPNRLMFEWGRMGTLEFVPKWVLDNTDPNLRTHLACNGQTVLKIDQPFGYLNVMAHYGNWAATLDDGVTNYQMPNYPALDEYSVPAIRCIP